MLMKVEHIAQIWIQQRGISETQNITFEEFQRVFLEFFQKAGELTENGDTYKKSFQIFQRYQQSEKDFILQYCWNTFREYTQNPIQTMIDIKNLQKKYVKMLFPNQSNTYH